jgi:GNAT superfamily N-acetyltransferase
MLIRPATPDDAAAIWAIIAPVIRAGETYTLDRDMSERDALGYWFGADKEAFVAEADGAVLGTYYLRANQAGGGPPCLQCRLYDRRGGDGRGVARTMALHSIDHARSRGFRAMQFNFVVSSNVRAVGCGSRWGSTSSGGCRARSIIPPRASSMRW